MAEAGARSIAADQIITVRADTFGTHTTAFAIDEPALARPCIVEACFGRRIAVGVRIGAVGHWSTVAVALTRVRISASHAGTGARAFAAEKVDALARLALVCH